LCPQGRTRKQKTTSYPFPLIPSSKKRRGKTKGSGKVNISDLGSKQKARNPKNTHSKIIPKNFRKILSPVSTRKGKKVVTKLKNQRDKKAAGGNRASSDHRPKKGKQHPNEHTPLSTSSTEKAKNDPNYKEGRKRKKKRRGGISSGRKKLSIQKDKKLTSSSEWGANQIGIMNRQQGGATLVGKYNGRRKQYSTPGGVK